MTVVSEYRSRLWIIASVVWLAWLLGVLVMWFDYRWHVMHPYFLPLVSLMLIQTAGGLTLLAAALWRIGRGPRRVHALGWLLLGTTPLWISTSHFSYGAWSLYEQHAALTPTVKMTSAAVASLADLVIRYRHRHQLESQHTVLFHDSAAMPREQLAAIDRHIEQMEQTLGRSPQGKIHWIRGQVFGHQGEPGGWYLGGLAIVTRPAAGVDYIDRHEVAHAVIDRHCGPDAQPPLVLVEGWAESQSGYDPGFLALRAWQRKKRGQILSLRELTGERWYGCGDRPVYVYGGALVEYLLDEFGGPKFLDLYTTCRRNTFADDCRRVLGVDLDVLDHEYWEFVEQRVGALAPERVNPLLDVPLADGVDREAWIDFARAYPAASASLTTRLERVSLEYRGTYQAKQAEPLPIRLTILHDGSRRRITFEGSDEQYAIVASPRHSFLARRRDGQQPWTLDLENHRGNPFVDYCASRELIEREEGKLIACGPEGVFQRGFLSSRQQNGFRVTRFERLSAEDEGVVRLDFEYSTGTEPEPWQSHEGWFELLPERQWAVRQYEGQSTSKDVSRTWRASFEYGDRQSPAVVPRRAIWEYDSPTTKTHRDVTLTAFDFAPDADDAFELESFGLSATDIPDRSRVPWYVVTTAIVGLGSLLLGPTLILFGSRRMST